MGFDWKNIFNNHRRETIASIQPEVTGNPWVGLSAYQDPEQSEEKLQFCGRDHESYDVAELIDDNIFVTLYGKSGMGKTSLLNAGVFPLLRLKQYLPVSVRLGMEAQNDKSFQQCIIDKIAQIFAGKGRVEHIPVVDLPTDQTDVKYLWSYFARTKWVRSLSRNEISGIGEISLSTTTQTIFPVVVLDQFEEVYRTRRDEAEILLRQIHFMMDETHALADRTIGGKDYEYDFNFRFVVSIREDDLYRLEDSIDNNYLAEMKRCRYRLRSLTDEGARDVIVMPGEGLYEQAEQEDIVNAIMDTSRNADDGSINTNILSLLCSRLFVEHRRSGSRSINKSMVDKFLTGNPFERFYNEATRALSEKEKSYIEDHLIDSDNRRNSVSERDFMRNIRHWRSLLEGDHKIVQNTSGRIELIHDSFCAPIAQLKQQRQQRRRRRQIMSAATAAVAIIALATGLSLMFWNMNEKNKQANKDLLASNTELAASQKVVQQKQKETDSINTELEVFIAKLQDEQTAKEKANNELKNMIAQLTASEAAKEQANRNLAQSNQALEAQTLQLTQERENLKKANWGLMEAQAIVTANEALDLINSGNVYKGLALAMQTVPTNFNDPPELWDKPFVKEAERAIREGNNRLEYINGGICTFPNVNWFVGINEERQFAMAIDVDSIPVFYDLRTGEEIDKWSHVLPKQISKVDNLEISLFIAISPNGRYVIAQDFDSSKMTGNRSLSVYELLDDGVRFVARLGNGLLPHFSSDGKMLSIMSYNMVDDWYLDDLCYSSYDTNTWNRYSSQAVKTSFDSLDKGLPVSGCESKIWALFDRDKTKKTLSIELRDIVTDETIWKVKLDSLILDSLIYVQERYLGDSKRYLGDSISYPLTNHIVKVFLDKENEFLACWVKYDSFRDYTIVCNLKTKHCALYDYSFVDLLYDGEKEYVVLNTGYGVILEEIEQSESLVVKNNPQYYSALGPFDFSLYMNPLQLKKRGRFSRADVLDYLPSERYEQLVNEQAKYDSIEGEFNVTEEMSSLFDYKNNTIISNPKIHYAYINSDLSEYAYYSENYDSLVFQKSNGDIIIMRRDDFYYNEHEHIISPNMRYIVKFHGSTPFLWDIENINNESIPIQGCKSIKEGNVYFSDDDKVLIISQRVGDNEYELRFFDTSDGHEFADKRININGFIRTFRMSSAFGIFIVIVEAEHDNKLYLFDYNTAKCTFSQTLFNAASFNNGIGRIRFSNDNKSFFLKASNNLYFKYDIPDINDLIRQYGYFRNYKFTTEERQKYGLSLVNQ